MAGALSGEMKEAGVEAFRSQYGALEGAALSKLKGWRAESVYRETCNQTAVTYYNPEGRSFTTVKAAEAHLGNLILNGMAIPDIEEARRSLVRGTNGKVINEARVEIGVTKAVDGTLKVSAKRARFADPDAYEEHKTFTVLLANGTDIGNILRQQDMPAKEASEWEVLSAEVCKLLAARGFGENVDLVIVRGVASDHKCSSLQGLYYRMVAAVDDRPCYQKVHKVQSGTLACSGLYMFWSKNKGQWRFGVLDDAKAAFAFCIDDQISLTKLTQPWMLLSPAS